MEGPVAEGLSSVRKPIPCHTAPGLGACAAQPGLKLWTQWGLLSPDTVWATPAQSGRPKFSGVSPCR